MNFHVSIPIVKISFFSCFALQVSRTVRNRLVLDPPVTLVVHGLGDLDETSNVGAGNEGRKLALSSLDVGLGSVETVEESVLHDVLETLINLRLGPVEALAVLGHLETGNGDTTAVGGLARGVPDGLALVSLAVVLEDLDSLESAAHVGTLSDELAAGSDETLSLLLGDLVLGSARKSDVDLANVEPGASTLDPLDVAVVLEGGKGLTGLLDSHDGVDILNGDAGLASGDEGTLGVGERDDGGTELDELEGSVLGDVAGTGEGNALASVGASAGVLEHVADVVDETVTSGLGADQRTTPGEALAGKDTLETVGSLAVGAEHVTDLAATNTDITSGNIGIGTNVLGKLSHESAAEATDLRIGLALGVEVGTTLATTHAH